MSTSTKGLHDRGVQGVAVVTFVGAARVRGPVADKVFWPKMQIKGEMEQTKAFLKLTNKEEWTIR